MGKRGPAKTPTVKLANRGSWRAKERKEEPVFETIKFDLQPPKILKSSGLSMWNKILPMLIGQSVITQADIAALTRYCFYWQKWLIALNDDETKVSDLSKLENMILRLEMQFGLTPASRPNIKANTNDNSSQKQTEEKEKPNYFKLA